MASLRERAAAKAAIDKLSTDEVNGFVAVIKEENWESLLKLVEDFRHEGFHAVATTIEVSYISGENAAGLHPDDPYRVAAMLASNMGMRKAK